MKKFTYWLFTMLLLGNWQNTQAQVTCQMRAGYISNTPVVFQATDFVVNPIAGGNYTFSIKQPWETTGTPFVAIDTIEPCSLKSASSVSVRYTNPNGVVYTCSTSIYFTDSSGICAPQLTCTPLTIALPSDRDTAISAFQFITNAAAGGYLNYPYIYIRYRASYVSTTRDSARTFTCSQLGTQPITIYYLDDYGHSSNCQTSLTITDPNSYCNPPVTCRNQTVYLSPNLAATVTPRMLVTNYDTTATYTLALGNGTPASSLQLGCANMGTNTITITKLLNGTRQLCTSTVTLQDTGNYCAPRVSCQPVTVTLGSTAATTLHYGRFLSSYSPNGTIAVSINGITDTLFSVGCGARFGVGTYTVLVTNAAYGQIARCTTTLTVTAPTGVCYPALACQPRTVYLTPNLSASVTPQQVVSNYDTTFTYWLANRTTSGQNSILSYNCSNIGTDTVTVFRRDPYGNTQSCITAVTIADTGNYCTPRVTCRPMTVGLSSTAATTLHYLRFVSSVAPYNSSISVAINGVTDTLFNIGCTTGLGVGTHQVVVTNSANGQIARCTTALTVTDTNNVCTPLICQNNTVYLSPNLVATVTPAAVVSNMVASATYTIALTGATTGSSYLQLGCANIGTQNVTVTRTLNGTTQTCATTLTVADSGNYCTPRVTCQPMSLNLTSTSATTLHYRRFVSTYAPYNGSISVTINGVTDTLFNIGCTTGLGVGTHQVVVTNSANGQIARCTTTLTVTDTNNVCTPLICRNNTVYLTPNLAATVTPATVVSNMVASATYTIALTGSTNGGSTLQFGCSNIGTQNVTVTRTLNGATQTCATTVTVADSGNYCAPRITCQPVAITVSLASTTTVAAAQFISAFAPFNGAISVMIDSVVGSSFVAGCNAAIRPGVHQVVVTNTANGQIARCTTTLTVTEPTGSCNPAVACQNRTVSLTPNLAAMVTPQMLVTNYDSTAIYSLTLSNGIAAPYLALGCSNIGTNTIVITKTLNGIRQTCTSVVTVTDSAGYCTPRVTCQPMTVTLSSAATTTVHYRRFVSSSAPYNSSISVAINGVTDTLFSVGCTTILGVGTHQVVVTNSANGQIARCTTTLTVTDPNNYCAPAGFACHGVVANITPNMVAVVNATQFVTNPLTTGYYLFGVDTMSATTNYIFNCSQVGTHNVIVTQRANNQVLTCSTTVTITDTNHICQTPTPCVNPANIDSSFACAYTYVPVCGCDTVTYRNACIAEHWYGVTSWRAGACPTRAPIQIVPTVQTHDCNNTTSCTGSIQLAVTGGIAPYAARWSDVSTATSLTRSNICPNTYTVTITDAAGSTAISNVIVGYSRGCVWAGDTDDDARVSYFDVLPIALTHGESGSIRPNASLNWTAQPCSNWATVHPIAGLPNYKHIDADGNGVINQLDMQAVINNYSHSYYRTNSVEGNIPFYIESIITQEGARLALPIMLGTNSVVADNVYGVAFTIEYDPTMVDAGSLSVDFTNSWLGSDLLTFYHEDAATGRLEIVAARKDRLNITNFGAIGALNMTIRDDILRAGTRIMDLNISNVRLIDNANAIIGTMRPTGTVTVDLAQSVETAANAKLTVFPNPAEDIINIQLSEANAQQIRLYNMAGQLIRDIQMPTSSLVQLNAQDLPSGIYTVSVVTDKGVMTERVQIKR